MSVIIVTRNRPVQLSQCLHALNSNTESRFELIVIDESSRTVNTNIINELGPGFMNNHYYKLDQIGKSKGLNFGIQNCGSSIIAFTDDDCIVDKNWLSIILNTFKTKPHIAGVFGRTLPYQPERNKKLICPCTFGNLKSHLIITPSRHWESIGFGNNMAFRKEVFEDLGGFKEWLGPGSIGSNAEDAEMALRVLSSGKKLYYNSQLIVYHNRWLSHQEYNKQQLSYICGETACYGYLSVQGYKFADRVIYDNLSACISEFKQALKTSLYLKPSIISEWFWFLLRLAYRVRGLIIGWYFGRIY